MTALSLKSRAVLRYCVIESGSMEKKTTAVGYRSGPSCGDLGESVLADCISHSQRENVLHLRLSCLYMLCRFFAPLVYPHVVPFQSLGSGWML